jgi:hypothetical protein
MSATDHRARAIRAEQLLGDELLTEALAEIETAALEALASANVSDFPALQRHTAELQAARAVRDRLKSIVTQTKFSDREAPSVA